MKKVAWLVVWSRHCTSSSGNTLEGAKQVEQVLVQLVTKLITRMHIDLLSPLLCKDGLLSEHFTSPLIL